MEREKRLNVRCGYARCVSCGYGTVTTLREHGWKCLEDGWRCPSCVDQPSKVMGDTWIRPHGFGTRESYAYPDPTAEHRERASHKARYDVKNLTQDDGFALAEMAETYHHMLTHPMGTEKMIKQLREVRRCIEVAERKGG